MFSMIRLTIKARYLAASLCFTLIALISGQSILFYEIRSLTLAHCRRLNLQNIFLYNELSSLEGFHSELTRPSTGLFEAPSYCSLFLQPSELSAIKNPSNAESIARVNMLIRLYADRYSDKERRYGQIQMSLLILLLISNVVALALLSFHLYEDSKEVAQVLTKPKNVL